MCKQSNKYTIVEKSRTVSGDVVDLLYYQGEYGERSYTLCKTLMMPDKESNHWIYMLLVQDDPYPLVITETCAKAILENPTVGATLVFNHWFHRYR